MTVGIDRIDRSRVKRLLKVSHFNPAIVCTSKEVALLKKSKDPVLCFALLFGAKEATSKALKHSVVGPGMLKSYEVFFSKNKPYCRFNGNLTTKNAQIYSINIFLVDPDGWVITAVKNSGVTN